jgi:Glycosyl transferases group 1
MSIPAASSLRRNDMRLLVAELRAFSHYVSREFAWIMRELIEIHGWTHVEPSILAKQPGTLEEKIVRSCGECARIVLFWGGEDFLCAFKSQVTGLRCAKWFVADDLHHRDLRKKRREAFLLCDTIFSTYAYRLADFFPEVARSRRIVWLPHAASPDFEYSMNERAENRLLLSGAINSAYPLRLEVKRLMESGFEGIVRVPHPGYHCGYDYERDNLVGRGFSKKIWRRRAAFSDCSKHGYLLAKHFEIPATGALLVADEALSAPLKELGFSGGVHYFPVTKKNLKDRLRYLLEERHHPALDEIRRKGQTLVFERHRTSHRAKLINSLGEA